MQQKCQLLSEQFSSPLLLAVACVAGSRSVCFSFLVEIQRRERERCRRMQVYSKELSSARPVARFFSVRVRSNEKTDQTDCTCFLEGRGRWDN